MIFLFSNLILLFSSPFIRVHLIASGIYIRVSLFSKPRQSCPIASLCLQSQTHVPHRFRWVNLRPRPIAFKLCSMTVCYQVPGYMGLRRRLDLNPTCLAVKTLLIRTLMLVLCLKLFVVACFLLSFPLVYVQCIVPFITK